MQNTEEEPIQLETRSKLHPPHTRGTFHRRLKPLYTEKHKVSCSGSSSKQSPLHCGKKKRQTDRSRNRCTREVPIIAGCSHLTRKNTRLRAPASSQQHSPCNIHAAIPMRSATANSRNAENYAHSFKNYVTTSHRHQLPSSPLPFLTTSLRHHFPSSPLPFVTTSLPHHFPSSPPPIVPTSLPHHSPSSPLPIVPTSLPHPSPSSPLPSVATSLHHHFPSSALPFIVTSLHHHFPSSPPCLIASYSFVIYCYCIVM